MKLTAASIKLIDQPRFTPNLDFDPAIDARVGTITTKKKKVWHLLLPQGHTINIVRATKLSADEAHYMRTCFPPDQRDEYRERWAQFLDVKVSALEGWRIHHRQPVCIGGSHKFSNLDFLPDEIHNPLHHDFIDPQTHMAAVGSTYNYLIPVRRRPFRIRGNAKRPKRERPEHAAALVADF